MLKAILFDVDGTLANTEDTHRKSFNDAFSEFGLGYHWSEQEYIDLLSISGGRERLISFLKSRNFQVKGDMDLRDFSYRLHERKSEIYRQKLVDGHIALRCGVERLIHEARNKGMKLGIATASSLRNVETLIHNNLGSGGMSLFDVVVTSDIIKDKKPSPVVYQFATAELGLTPDHCVAIEDTSNGNRSALLSGIRTVITTHAFTKDDDFTGASLIIDQLGEPDSPFQVDSGNAYGFTFVNTELLEKIVVNGQSGIRDGQREAVALFAK